MSVCVCVFFIAYRVARAHHVATCEPVALEVEAACFAAPALVPVLGGHVRGVSAVAVSQTFLFTKKKKGEQPNAS